jgi:hypothetical protein
MWERHGFFKTVVSLAVPRAIGAWLGVEDLVEHSKLLAPPCNAHLDDKAKSDVSTKSRGTRWSRTGAKRVSLTHNYYILLETINLNDATEPRAKRSIVNWQRTTKRNQIMLHLGEGSEKTKSQRVLNKDDVFNAVNSVRKRLFGAISMLNMIFYPDRLGTHRENSNKGGAFRRLSSRSR